MTERQTIEVRRGGVLVEVVRRACWGEVIGNFNPIFCRYKGARYLVSSREGDLSDPFRRSEMYLQTLFIEVGHEILLGR